MSVSVRDYLAAELAPLLLVGWKVIPEQRMPDTIKSTTVVLKHLSIEKLAEAPAGHLRNEVVLTVATPHEDIAKAENALDDAVVKLLSTLDGHKTINWASAKKAQVTDAYLGWDITLTVITEKES